MAVVDLTQYKNTTNLPIDAVAVAGVDSLEIVALIPITSGDSIGSIYRFAEIPGNFIPVSGEITCDAITSVNDVDIGIYETTEHGDGVLSVDALLNGGDLSSALLPGGGISPVSAVAIGDQNKALYLLASDVSGERQNYVLGLFLNAAATGNGTAVIRLKLVRRQYEAV